VKSKFEEKRNKALATDKTISDLVTQRDRHSKEITDNEIEIKKLDHKIGRFHKDKKDASHVLKQLEEKYNWIASEKQYHDHSNTFLFFLFET
jgi:structural maintenance of chromosome 2